MDAELIKNALATARNSLSTYGQHPIIEKQIDKAMEEVDKIEAKSKEVAIEFAIGRIVNIWNDRLSKAEVEKIFEEWYSEYSKQQK